jgi:hypothetical protein
MTTIYHLIDPRDGGVRYVGKTRGSLRRRLSQHLRRGRRRHDGWRRWLAELAALGQVPAIVSVREVETKRDKLAEYEAISDARSTGAKLLNVHHW